MLLIRQLVYYMRVLDQKLSDEVKSLGDIEANELTDDLKPNHENVEPKQFYVDPYSFEEVPFKVKPTTGLKDPAFETEFESLRITEWDGGREDKTSSIVSWSGSRDMRAPQSPPRNTLKESFGDFTPISFRSIEDNDNKTDSQQQSEDIGKKAVENQSKSEPNDSENTEEVKKSSNNI